jgi:hypothetical protein
MLMLMLQLLLTQNSADELPFVRSRKWIRNERCLSAASFGHFPFFAPHKREPEGQRMRSPSFAYIFLAKQEK